MRVAYPDWIDGGVAWDEAYPSPEDRMRLAIGIALANVARGGGPFGAAICDDRGKVVAAGYNNVVQDLDLTAHAEIVSVRNAQKELSALTLSSERCGPLDLFTSMTPCIMCYGVIWLAGLRRVYAAANNEDARQIGFVHGHVTDRMWNALQRETSTAFVGGFCRDERALEPLRRYARAGGPIYI